MNEGFVFLAHQEIYIYPPEEQSFLAGMGRMGDWILKWIDISLMICIYIYEDIYIYVCVDE